MSFERLPLALALSITLLGGNLLAGANAVQAKPILEGQTSCSGYSLDSGKTLLIAAKDSGDVSADSAAGDADKNKNKKDTAKDKKETAKEKKEAEKAEKVAKEEKNDKDGKDKKAAKADKGNARVITEEPADKKKGKGFFHKRNPEEEKIQAESSKAAVQAKRENAEEQKEVARIKAEKQIPPVYIPDDALISVLRDVNKSLADGQTEQIQKIENSNEKMILGFAQEILAKALAEPNLNGNRIVAKDTATHFKSAITAESWSSGDVIVSDKLRGSLAAVWAKRIGGLLTVTIAGDAGDRKTVDGTPIGEFMVVVTAHSPVQSGFDIQSQGDVTFWIGKLNSITVESNCVPSADTASSEKAETSSSADTTSHSAGDSKKKSITSLSPLLTNRYRKHYEILLMADRQSKRAEAELASTEGTEKSPAVSGDDAVAQKASAKNEKEKDSARDAGKHAVKEAANESSKDANKDGGAKDSVRTAVKETSTDTSTVTRADNDRPGNERSANDRAVNDKVGGDKSNDDKSANDRTANNAFAGGRDNQIAMAGGATQATATDGTNTAGAVIDAGPHFHMPSASSTLLMPDRALAGQYVTVALLDRARFPEANVQLSFNGASLCTDEKGQALYQIPDDTTPGRSLNVALSARPDEVPATIEVLQPLNTVEGQPPRLDRMTPLAIKNSIMTLDGHNFDGTAHNNSVIVDGSLEGHIVSASPYQLKVLLPQSLRPGPHSLCVSTEGMRSNLGGFDYADTLITVDGKDNGRENSNIKLLVKVIGTTAKMNVKILNQTPDVIRLNRGAEMTVTSSGGVDNIIQLPAVRAKRGPFTIDTQIEM